MACVSPLVLTKHAATFFQHGMGLATSAGEISLIGFLQFHWRNKFDRISPIPLAKQVQVRKINFACKLETGVTFDRNVRLRSIICQNARN